MMECAITSFNISPQACDQCFVSKVKCSKDLPSCLVCVKKRKGCTYLRNLKKKLDFTVERTSSEDSNLFIVYAFDKDESKNNKLNSSEDSSASSRKNSEPLVQSKNILLSATTIKQFNGIQKTRSSKTHQKTDKGGNLRKNKDDRFETSYCKGSLIPAYAANIRGFKPMKTTRRGSYFFNEVSLLQGNQPTQFFSAGSSWTGYYMKILGDVHYDILMAIHFKIKYELPILIKMPKKSLQLKNLNPDRSSSANEYFEIHRRAFLAYFTHINDYIPLFFQSNFFSKSRSPLLILAIIISGLRFIECSPLVTKLSDHYQERFLELIRPHRTHLNLDYLQAMLVAYIGFRGLGILLKLSWLCPGLVIDVAHQLGLQFFKKRINTQYDFDIERELAYSAIVYHDSLKTLTLDIPGLICISHSNILDSQIDSSSDKLFSTDKLLLIHSRFNLKQAIVVQKLTYIKIKAGKNLLSTDFLGTSLRNLMMEYHASLTTSLREVMLILKSMQNCEEINRSKLFINHLYIEFYYIYLQAYSVYFTYVCEDFKSNNKFESRSLSSTISPSQNLPKSTTNLKKAFNGFTPSLLSSFAACVQMIDICSTFHSDPSYHERILCLTYALVFLIRRWKLFPNFDKLQISVHHGLNYLHSLRSSFYFNARATLTITFIEQISAVYGYKFT